jgi:hypothetical protein
LGKEKSRILGVDHTATDLNEQQLKVLRLGDPSFSAHQYVKTADQEHSVVLGPGDVMYHPAGTVLCNSASGAFKPCIDQVTVESSFDLNYSSLFAEQVFLTFLAS